MMREASRALARAFASNPGHIAAFGRVALARNEFFFGAALAVMKGPKLVATDGSRVVGLIHWVPSSHCQISRPEMLRLIPRMVAALGAGATLRVMSWLYQWSRHDPTDAHLHLGPIGVIPEAQGRRIGSQLMTRYCDELTARAEPGYLETDRPENVAFYRQFGFETTKEIRVLGVRQYLMRCPVTSSPAGPSP